MRLMNSVLCASAQGRTDYRADVYIVGTVVTLAVAQAGEEV